jgi:7-keto-8-aminopelargonate synthetase-like enzyme
MENSKKVIFAKQIKTANNQLINLQICTEKLKNHLTQELESIREAGLYKQERIIVSPQDAEIMVSNGSRVLNFCANNYLGLSNHPSLIEAAKEGLWIHTDTECLR